MYTNILLPTDGLGKCKFGTCHGVLLAKGLGAKVTAVCVTEDLSFQEIRKIYDAEILVANSVAEVERGVKKRAEDLHREPAGKALEVAERMCAANGVKCERVHLLRDRRDEDRLAFEGPRPGAPLRRTDLTRQNRSVDRSRRDPRFPGARTKKETPLPPGGEKGVCT